MKRKLIFELFCTDCMQPTQQDMDINVCNPDTDVFFCFAVTLSRYITDCLWTLKLVLTNTCWMYTSMQRVGSTYLSSIAGTACFQWMWQHKLISSQKKHSAMMCSSQPSSDSILAVGVSNHVTDDILSAVEQFICITWLDACVIASWAIKLQVKPLLQFTTPYSFSKWLAVFNISVTIESPRSQRNEQ